MGCLLEKLDKISIFKIQYRHLQTMQMERKGIVIEKENIFCDNVLARLATWFLWFRKVQFCWRIGASVVSNAVAAAEKDNISSGQVAAGTSLIQKTGVEWISSIKGAGYPPQSNCKKISAVKITASLALNRWQFRTELCHDGTHQKTLQSPVFGWSNEGIHSLIIIVKPQSLYLCVSVNIKL